MNSITGFLIYVALYRLAVLAVGALSIWLGFRLFQSAGSKGKNADSAGSASAEGGGFKISLTSILPGTYFALFGTVIISIMLWKGEPQQLQKELSVTTPNGTATYSKEILMRTNCQSYLGNISSEWDKLHQSGLTLADSAEPLHKIACFYWKENRIGEAVSLARLAALYGKDTDKSRHLRLLAELLRANGNEEEAAKTIQAAEAMQKQGE